jgi:hypothetical protein
MLYSVIFLILSSSVCIYLKERWEIFVDRLDLLIKGSYLIIQCNENEVEIVRLFSTFEEFESNLKCTNKNYSNMELNVCQLSILANLLLVVKINLFVLTDIFNELYCDFLMI